MPKLTVCKPPWLAVGLTVALASCAASQPLPAGANTHFEAAFGPEAGAEGLILKAIASARQSLCLAAFALSSPTIIQALIAAKRRGVDVQVVADHAHNVVDDPKGKGRAALAALTRAGIPVRTNSHYRKHHDKYLIADGLHVQTGSYNYAQSANRNSENVLLVWNAPALAQQYRQHWQSRFDEGAAFSPDD